MALHKLFIMQSYINFPNFFISWNVKSSILKIINLHIRSAPELFMNFVVWEVDQELTEQFCIIHEMRLISNNLL